MPNKIKGFQILNVVGSKSADLYIYDVVGFDGTDATTVVKQISQLDVEQINVRINSPGGSVFDGFAIYNALNAHKAKVVVNVDGLAASIAAIIAMAGDDIIIAENAMMMVHEPSVIVGGTASRLRKQADVLEQLHTNIVDILAARSGMERKVVEAMVAEGKETWLNATEAVSKGFATAIGAKLKMAACAAFDLAPLNFKDAPADRSFDTFSVPSEEPASPAFDCTPVRRKRLALAAL